MATITIPKVLANFETTLSSQISDVASSMTIDRSTDDDGSALSGLYSVTIDEGTSSEEHMAVTFAGAAGTITRRGLSRVDGWTERSGNKFLHDRGAVVKITNFSLLNISRLLSGTDAFNSVAWTGVASVAGLSTPTSGETTKAANVAYVNAAVAAGSVDASTSAKGVSEEATDAELAAGTAAGGTGARLFAGGASHSQTAAATKVPVSKSSGKLDDGWLGLTTAGDIAYSDGTDLQRLGPTTARFLRMNGTTPEWGGANLDEADTFFGATDITGAEAETLTAGPSSDASLKHRHDEYDNARASAAAGTRFFLGGFGDGLTSFAAGTGAVRRTALATELFSTASGDDAGLNHGAESICFENDPADRNYEWNDITGTNVVRAFASVQFSGAVTQDFFFGLEQQALSAAPANATLTNRHVAWMVEDGTLYYSVADGTTQTRASTACTLTDRNLLEIKYDGTTATFYLNGAQVAAVTSNVPGGTSNDPYFNVIYTGQSANDQSCVVYHPFGLKLATS